GTNQPEEGACAMKWSGSRRHWLMSAAALVGGTIAWQASGRRAPPRENGRWEPVREADISQAIAVHGQIQPGAVVHVSAPFDGRIVRKWVSPGDRVEQGAPLF